LNFFPVAWNFSQPFCLPIVSGVLFGISDEVAPRIYQIYENGTATLAATTSFGSSGEAFYATLYCPLVTQVPSAEPSAPPSVPSPLQGCFDLFTTFNNGSQFAATENGTTTVPVTNFLNLTNPTNLVNSIEYSIFQDLMFILHLTNANNGLVELLTLNLETGQTHFIGDVTFQGNGFPARKVQGLAIERDSDVAYTWRNDTLMRIDLSSGNVTQVGTSDPPRIDMLDLAYDNLLDRVYSLKVTDSTTSRIHIWNPANANRTGNILVDLPTGVALTGIAATPDNGEFDASERLVND
jgi:hypothetical protein